MAKGPKPRVIGDRPLIRYATVAVSVLGLIISAYALYVEKRLHDDDTYKPLCDINEELRCSKALSSKYGYGFGFLGNALGPNHILNLPNTVYGIIFYILIALLGYARNAKASTVQLNLCFISVMVSGWLAYVLLFILDEKCPVCFATYAINAVLLLLSIFKGSPRLAEPRDAMGAIKKTDGDQATKKASVAPKESKSVPNVDRDSKTYTQATKQETKSKARRE
ncbi:hypothetical protein RvY_02175 [Ramazzottius varieornatus]|uniref:vitamin-K-epoxide reductase (warfarin-sensitive) n=1 Tax=Ramazzottius varieornatus TaxID=947166 RepID=A0A1D1UQU5_RAMVA|nr:hypothetical protein RvY_02175 [Ramazzottius varieornatus]